MSDYHFILTEPIALDKGDLIVSRYDSDDRIVGLDRITRDCRVVSLPGRVTKTHPLDERARMPISINGVQLWWGWPS